MLRDPLHSRFLDTGSRERRLAYFAETPETPPPEPAAPPPEPVSNRGEMLRKQADIIDQLENAGESYKDILSRAVEQYMEDGEMQLEEAQGLALQVDGVLAHLNSSLRVPEELQNTESMLLLAQNAGLISPEALGAVSRRYEGAPGGRSERRYARGAVRTGYDRERKMWYKEQHNGSAWQTIEEKSIEQCRQEGLIAARERGWSQPNYARSEVEDYGREIAQRSPHISAHARQEMMHEYRRAIQRNAQLSMPPPERHGTPRTSYTARFTPEQVEYARSTGVGLPYGAEITGGTRSGGGGGVDAYQYPSGFVPYARGESRRYLQQQDELKNMYATNMAEEMQQKMESGEYARYQDDPAFPSVVNALKNAKRQWERNPGRMYGDLAWFRTQTDAIAQRNKAQHYVLEQMEQRDWQFLDAMTIGRAEGFQPSEVIRITYYINPRDSQRNYAGGMVPLRPTAPADMAYSKPVTIAYEPYKVNGGLTNAQMEDLFDYAGILVQPEYYGGGARYTTMSYDRPRVKAVHVRFAKPGRYVIDGKEKIVDGQEIEPRMLAKRRQQVVDLKEMAQKLEDTDPLKPLVMQLDVKTDREGTVAIVMPGGATTQLSYIVGRTDTNTWAIAPSMEIQEAAYEVFQNPDDVYEAIRETLSHKLAPKETPLDAPTETPLAALDPVPVPLPTEAPGASAEHESGTATESTEAAAERGVTPENATEEQPKSVEHPTPLRTWPPPLDVLSESESPFVQGMENIRRAKKNDEARRDAGGVWKDSEDLRWGERKGYWQYPGGIQWGADDPPPGWVLPESEPVQNVLPASIQETPVSERAMEFVSTLKQAIRQIDLQKGDGSNESHVQRMNEIAPQMLAYAQSTENLSDRLLIAEAFISLQLLGFGGYTERGRELLRENVAQHRHFPSAMALTVGTTPEERRKLLDNAKTLIRSQEDQKIWEEADAQLREIEQSRARERAEKERIKEEDRRMTEIVNQQIQQTGLEVKYNSQSGALILDQGNGTLVLEGEQAKNWWPEEELRAEGIEIKYIAGNVEIKDAEKVTFPATLKHIGGRLRLNGVQEPIQFPQQMLIDDGVDIVNIEKPKMDAVLQAMDAAKVESTNANMRDIILHMRIQKDAYTKDALREWGEKYESFWIEEDEELK